MQFPLLANLSKEIPVVVFADSVAVVVVGVAVTVVIFCFKCLTIQKMFLFDVSFFNTEVHFLHKKYNK